MKRNNVEYKPLLSKPVSLRLCRNVIASKAKQSCSFRIVGRKIAAGFALAMTFRVRASHYYFFRNDTINIFLFCLLFFLLSGCGKREITNISSKGKNIICFGDSITLGYGAEPRESYPNILAEISGLTVINAGIDGDTSAEGLERINNDVLSRDPLLVIIEFGGNDFLKQIPLEQTADNIRTMIDRIHGKGAMAAVVDISAGLLLKNYRPLLYKIAKEKKAVFIPSILSGIITNPRMKSDFLHPNGEGYKIIARKIYKEIRPFLKTKIILPIHPD